MRAASLAVAGIVLSLWAADYAYADMRVEVPSIRTVTALHRNEDNPALTFAAGYVWVGQTQSVGTSDRAEKLAGPRLRSKTNPPEAYHRVEIYRPGSSTPTDVAELIHTPSHLYAIDADTVIAIGRSAHPWQTHYSRLKVRKDGTIQVRTTSFTGDDAVLIQGFAKTSTDWFFPAADEDATPTVAAGILPRAIVRENLDWVSDRLLLPGPMEGVGEKLVAIEYLDMFRHDDDRIVVIDPETGEKSILPETSNRSHPTFLKAIDASKVAISETGANKVLVLDADKKSLVQEVEVQGAPQGIARYGKCLAVTTMLDKTVEFLRVDEGKLTSVLRWDVKGAGNTLSRPSEIAVDPQGGSVFLRSNYGCPTCFPSMNSVVELKANGDALASACGASQG